jgi:hypothetical protein
MWSWVGLSRDTAESRSAPRVTAVTFDLTLASSYNPVFITSPFNLDPSKSVAGAETALINGLLAGETYLNIWR